jgi:hypothetical protein
MNRRYGSRRAFPIVFLLPALACAVTFSPKGSSQVKDTSFEQEVGRVLSRYDRLRLDPADAERRVRQTGRLTLETSAGTFELLLTPNDVRADNYRAVEVLEGGETRELPREPSRTFKGAVEGVSGSAARFTLDGGKVEGLIIEGGERFYVESAARYSREAAPEDLLFYRESDVIADPVMCGVETLSAKVNEQVSRTQSVGINESQLAAPVSPKRQAAIATEADFEFTQAFGSAAAANNEILSIMNQVDGVYQNEIGLTFKIAFQRAWSTQTGYPYTATTLSGLLDQLRTEWINNPPVPVEARDLVHMWTGRDLDGLQTGLAYDTVTVNNVTQRGVVCVVVPASQTRPAQTFSFGVSERQTNAVARTVVPAHEIGHNFSAHHPEEVGHPECALTIMSGMTQGTTLPTFCPFSRDEITGYVNFTINPTNTFTTQCLDAVSSTAPSVQFSTTDYRVTEGTSSVQITVTRSSGEGASTVQYQTADGSASERSDYTTAAGTLRFNAGETSKTFNVFITDDTYLEGLETFQVLLSNASNATVGTPSSATVSIVSNDTGDGPNPVRPQSFNADFFVRQHYYDFLNREPDQSGLDFWKNQTSNCGNPDLQVCRVNVSAAFFFSIEFQETGFYAIRVQRVAFGRRSGDSSRMPYREVVAAQRQIGEGVVVGQPGSDTTLANNKLAYAAQVAARGDFATRFPQTTADTFVDALYTSAGVTPAGTERQDAINAYNSGGRAAALRAVADSGSVRNVELRTAFVLLEYHGYLRRDPDQSGYDFWLGKLNQFNGDYIAAQMVNSFIMSIEYLQRFGP